MTRNLSSFVLEKCNGYEIIRHELARQEKTEFVPIDIVYEPVYNESVPVPCFFTDQFFLGYRSYIGRVEKGKKANITSYSQAISLLQKLLCQKRRYYEKTSSSMRHQRRHYLFFCQWTDNYISR